MAIEISNSDFLVLIYESEDEIGKIIEYKRREMHSDWIAKQIVKLLVGKIDAVKKECAL